MSVKALTKLLQQKYSTFNGSPFNIIDVTVNVPGDELANDVTVYLDKESATTVEAVSEQELLALGHQLLEEAFIQLAAPSRCSLHLSYQFFDSAVTEYERDETYYIGDWWDSELGYWVTRTYLNLYYNELEDPILSCDTWFNSWTRTYRPQRSKLLAFADAEAFSQFWDAVLQAPKYAALPVVAVDLYDMAHGYKVCQIEVTSTEAQQLKKSEYLTLVLGCRLFMYAVRFYRDNVRKVRVKVTTAAEELVFFERQGQTYLYKCWLDDGPVSFQLKQPLVFNGRAKRELKSYLQQRFRSNWLYGRLQIQSIELSAKDGYQVSVTIQKPLWFYLNPQRLERLMHLMEKLVWDVHNYYERPRRCALKVLDDSAWYLLVRLDVIDGGYRLIRKGVAKNYEPIFFDDGGFLDKLSERFQKDWDKYRYIYRPTKLIEK